MPYIHEGGLHTRGIIHESFDNKPNFILGFGTVDIYFDPRKPLDIVLVQGKELVSVDSGSSSHAAVFSTP